MQPVLHSASGSPGKDSDQGKAAGIALAAASGCRPSQALLPWARSRIVAEQLHLHHVPVPPKAKFNAGCGHRNTTLPVHG